MGADPRRILGPVLHQHWTAPRLRMMPPEDRRQLRKAFVLQRDRAETGELRADGASLVRLVDEVDRKERAVQFSGGGSRLDPRRAAERPLESRVADMKTALGLTPDPEKRAKTWAIAVDLHGSAAEAKRRGFRNPHEDA